MQQLLKKQDVADYFQVSIGKVEAMMKTGLPYFKDGANVRFNKQQIDEYIHTKTKAVRNT